MTVAEALMAGRPVITARGAPWRDIETHGVGWRADIGVEPLVVGLENALACDQSNLRELGQRGREWMRAEFSWAEVARKMAEAAVIDRGGYVSTDEKNARNGKALETP